MAVRSQTIARSSAPTGCEAMRAGPDPSPLSPTLRLLRWLAFIFFAAFIGLVIYIANSGQGSKYWSFLDHIPYGDKLGHFLLMGTLCLLLNVALRARTFQRGRATVLLGSLIIAAIATAEEITQLFLPSRTFALTDLAADYLGIFLAGRLAVWICRDR